MSLISRYLARIMSSKAQSFCQRIEFFVVLCFWHSDYICLIFTHRKVQISPYLFLPQQIYLLTFDCSSTWIMFSTSFLCVVATPSSPLMNIWEVRCIMLFKACFIIYLHVGKREAEAQHHFPELTQTGQFLFGHTDRWSGRYTCKFMYPIMAHIF